ncbi:MAG: DUF4366 domain-containing protein, partial [Eubacteriales bacterium]|nr:DUF4366 domain-containing protein [Eubacteriales bacterium]
MKRILAVMLACTMMEGGTSVTAFAASNETETQTETTVAETKTDEKASTNAEDSTTKSDDEKMTEAEVQEQINVTESDDGTVTFSYGDWQWSMGDTKESSKEGTVTDVNSYLHLRNGAGMNYDIIGHLLPGAQVEVIGEDGDWYHVIVPEQTGYVHSDYLKVLEKTGTKDVDEEMLGKLLYMMMLSSNSKNSAPLTPDGNMTLVDDIGSTTGAGQQFLTFVTKSGNTFYMIIDRNDKGEENVHFLNLVDEADLLALMDEDTANQIKQPDTTVEPVEEKTTEVTEPEPEKEPEPVKKKSPVIALILLFLLGAGGVAGFLYFKMNDKKKVSTDSTDPDAD